MHPYRTITVIILLIAYIIANIMAYIIACVQQERKLTMVEVAGDMATVRSSPPMVLDQVVSSNQLSMPFD